LLPFLPPDFISSLSNHRSFVRCGLIPSHPPPHYHELHGWLPGDQLKYSADAVIELPAISLHFSRKRIFTQSATSGWTLEGKIDKLWQP
jgi:hypothetical protein